MALSPYDIFYFIDFPYEDKLKHIIAFFTLSIFFYKSFKNIKNIYKFLILITFACVIEVAQTFVGREASIADILASIAGVLLFLLISKVIKENKNHKTNEL